MSEFTPASCNCGAVLPPDARFCHKCGRPLYDEPAFVEEAPAPPPPQLVAAPVAPPAIGFHNPVAVRVGLLSAALASLLGIIPLPLAPFWMLVRLLASGFFAVYLYQRRTGALLTLREGARLGWITGVFSFLMATILLTVSVVSIVGGPGLASFYKEQLSSSNFPGIDLNEAMRVLESPAALSMILLFSLFFLFLFFAFVPMLGGLMGAKVMEKE